MSSPSAPNTWSKEFTCIWPPKGDIYFTWPSRADSWIWAMLLASHQIPPTYNPQPSTLNSTPYPQPSTFNPQPSTLNSSPWKLNSKPSAVATLNSRPSTLDPRPSILHPKPSRHALDPRPSTLDPQPSIPNPKPSRHALNSSPDQLDHMRQSDSKPILDPRLCSGAPSPSQMRAPRVHKVPFIRTRIRWNGAHVLKAQGT